LKGKGIMRPRISVCVITLNEENNIVDCLESVKWAGEIIVVDSLSTDSTCKIAKRYTDKIFLNKFNGFAEQKNFAQEKATGDWILFLDADERVSLKLKEEITKKIGETNWCEESCSRGAVVGFYIKRRTYYLGKWVRHGGWYPDYQLRLIKRGKGRWEYPNDAKLHEKIVLNGRADFLKSDIYHFTYENFSHHLRVINHYSDIVSDEWIKRKKFCLLEAVIHTKIKFFETYIYKLGFLDGLVGFIISVTSAFYVFSKYVKLWEKERSENRNSNRKL